MTDYTFKLWKNTRTPMPDRIYINADGLKAKIGFKKHWVPDDPDPEPPEVFFDTTASHYFPQHLRIDPNRHVRVVEEALYQAGLDPKNFTWQELLEVCE